MSMPRLSRKSKFTLAAIVVGTAAVGVANTLPAMANTLPAMADTTVTNSASTRLEADQMGVDACKNLGYTNYQATRVHQNEDGSFTVTYYCY
jgi:hypothetical protein